MDVRSPLDVFTLFQQLTRCTFRVPPSTPIPPLLSAVPQADVDGEHPAAAPKGGEENPASPPDEAIPASTNQPRGGLEEGEEGLSTPLSWRAHPTASVAGSSFLSAASACDTRCTAHSQRVGAASAVSAGAVNEYLYRTTTAPQAATNRMNDLVEALGARVAALSSEEDRGAAQRSLSSTPFSGGATSSSPCRAAKQGSATGRVGVHATSTATTSSRWAAGGSDDAAVWASSDRPTAMNRSPTSLPTKEGGALDPPPSYGPPDIASEQPMMSPTAEAHARSGAAEADEEGELYGPCCMLGEMTKNETSCLFDDEDEEGEDKEGAGTGSEASEGPPAVVDNIGVGPPLPQADEEAHRRARCGAILSIPSLCQYLEREEEEEEEQQQQQQPSRSSQAQRRHGPVGEADTWLGHPVPSHPASPPPSSFSSPSPAAAWLSKEVRRAALQEVYHHMFTLFNEEEEQVFFATALAVLGLQHHHPLAPLYPTPARDAGPPLAALLLAACRTAPTADLCAFTGSVVLPVAAFGVDLERVVDCVPWSLKYLRRHASDIAEDPFESPPPAPSSDGMMETDGGPSAIHGSSGGGGIDDYTMVMRRKAGALLSTAFPPVDTSVASPSAAREQVEETVLLPGGGRGAHHFIRTFEHVVVQFYERFPAAFIFQPFLQSPWQTAWRGGPNGGSPAPEATEDAAGTSCRSGGGVPWSALGLSFAQGYTTVGAAGPSSLRYQWRPYKASAVSAAAASGLLCCRRCLSSPPAGRGGAARQLLYQHHLLQRSPIIFYLLQFLLLEPPYSPSSAAAAGEGEGEGEGGGGGGGGAPCTRHWCHLREVLLPQLLHLPTEEAASGGGTCGADGETTRPTTTAANSVVTAIHFVATVLEAIEWFLQHVPSPVHLRPAASTASRWMWGDWAAHEDREKFPPPHTTTTTPSERRRSSSGTNDCMEASHFLWSRLHAAFVTAAAPPPHRRSSASHQSGISPAAAASNAPPPAAVTPVLQAFEAAFAAGDNSGDISEAITRFLHTPVQPPAARAHSTETEPAHDTTVEAVLYGMMRWWRGRLLAVRETLLQWLVQSRLLIPPTLPQSYDGTAINASSSVVGGGGGTHIPVASVRSSTAGWRLFSDTVFPGLHSPVYTPFWSDVCMHSAVGAGDPRVSAPYPAGDCAHETTTRTPRGQDGRRRTHAITQAGSPWNSSNPPSSRRRRRPGTTRGSDDTGWGSRRVSVPSASLLSTTAQRQGLSVLPVGWPSRTRFLLRTNRFVHTAMLRVLPQLLPALTSMYTLHEQLLEVEEGEGPLAAHHCGGERDVVVGKGKKKEERGGGSSHQPSEPPSLHHLPGSGSYSFSRPGTPPPKTTAAAAAGGAGGAGLAHGGTPSPVRWAPVLQRRVELAGTMYLRLVWMPCRTGTPGSTPRRRGRGRERVSPVLHPRGTAPAWAVPSSSSPPPLMGPEAARHQEDGGLLEALLTSYRRFLGETVHEIVHRVRDDVEAYRSHAEEVAAWQKECQRLRGAHRYQKEDRSSSATTTAAAAAAPRHAGSASLGLSPLGGEEEEDDEGVLPPPPPRVVIAPGLQQLFFKLIDLTADLVASIAGAPPTALAVARATQSDTAAAMPTAATVGEATGGGPLSLGSSPGTASAVSHGASRSPGGGWGLGSSFQQPQQQRRSSSLGLLGSSAPLLQLQPLRQRRPPYFFRVRWLLAEFTASFWHCLLWGLLEIQQLFLSVRPRPSREEDMHHRLAAALAAAYRRVHQEGDPSPSGRHTAAAASSATPPPGASVPSSPVSSIASSLPMGTSGAMTAGADRPIFRLGPAARSTSPSRSTTAASEPPPPPSSESFNQVLRHRLQKRLAQQPWRPRLLGLIPSCVAHLCTAFQPLWERRSRRRRRGTVGTGGDAGSRGASVRGSASNLHYRGARRQPGHHHHLHTQLCRSSSNGSSGSAPAGCGTSTPTQMGRRRCRSHPHRRHRRQKQQRQRRGEVAETLRHSGGLPRCPYQGSEEALPPYLYFSEDDEDYVQHGEEEEEEEEGAVEEGALESTKSAGGETAGGRRGRWSSSRRCLPYGSGRSSPSHDELTNTTTTTTTYETEEEDDDDDEDLDTAFPSGSGGGHRPRPFDPCGSAAADSDGEEALVEEDEWDSFVSVDDGAFAQWVVPGEDTYTAIAGSPVEHSPKRDHPQRQGQHPSQEPPPQPSRPAVVSPELYRSRALVAVAAPCHVLLLFLRSLLACYRTAAAAEGEGGGGGGASNTAIPADDGEDFEEEVGVLWGSAVQLIGAALHLFVLRILPHRLRSVYNNTEDPYTSKNTLGRAANLVALTAAQAREGGSARPSRAGLGFGISPTTPTTATPTTATQDGVEEEEEKVVVGQQLLYLMSGLAAAYQELEQFQQHRSKKTPALRQASSMGPGDVELGGSPPQQRRDSTDPLTLQTPPRRRGAARPMPRPPTLGALSAALQAHQLTARQLWSQLLAGAVRQFAISCHVSPGGMADAAAGAWHLLGGSTPSSSFHSHAAAENVVHAAPAAGISVGVGGGLAGSAPRGPPAPLFLPDGASAGAGGAANGAGLTGIARGALLPAADENSALLWSAAMDRVLRLAITVASRTSLITNNRCAEDEEEQEEEESELEIQTPCCVPTAAPTPNPPGTTALPSPPSLYPYHSAHPSNPHSTSSPTPCIPPERRQEQRTPSHHRTQRACLAFLDVLEPSPLTLARLWCGVDRRHYRLRIEGLKLVCVLLSHGVKALGSHAFRRCLLYQRSSSSSPSPPPPHPLRLPPGCPASFLPMVPRPPPASSLRVFAMLQEQLLPLLLFGLLKERTKPVREAACQATQEILLHRISALVHNEEQEARHTPTPLLSSSARPSLRYMFVNELLWPQLCAMMEEGPTPASATYPTGAGLWKSKPSPPPLVMNSATAGPTMFAPPSVSPTAPSAFPSALSADDGAALFGAPEDDAAILCSSSSGGPLQCQTNSHSALLPPPLGSESSFTATQIPLAARTSAVQRATQLRLGAALAVDRQQHFIPLLRVLADDPVANVRILVGQLLERLLQQQRRRARLFPPPPGGNGETKGTLLDRLHSRWEEEEEEEMEMEMEQKEEGRGRLRPAPEGRTTPTGADDDAGVLRFTRTEMDQVLAPLLRTLTQDTDVDVRRAAAAALAVEGGKIKRSVFVFFIAVERGEVAQPFFIGPKTKVEPSDPTTRTHTPALPMVERAGTSSCLFVFILRVGVCYYHYYYFYYYYYLFFLFHFKDRIGGASSPMGA
eukprot:gene9495-6665_t